MLRSPAALDRVASLTEEPGQRSARCKMQCCVTLRCPIKDLDVGPLTPPTPAEPSLLHASYHVLCIWARDPSQLGSSSAPAPERHLVQSTLQKLWLLSHAALHACSRHWNGYSSLLKRMVLCHNNQRNYRKSVVSESNMYHHQRLAIQPVC
ncbi:hypothetical protein N657DRAFT_165550 [Parathielavia appendiculata]|uniref:Uncharacterized protein n=1 Tax=Parathielavia appendiculata TaxID=2587402 RepID=A0AAN6TT61_9PEZI|nr:hypothetical protein N657DRAFT_165550 [Parathielavia appendiculata]